MNWKKIAEILGFTPKNGACDVYEKEYSKHSYSIKIDFNKETIDYGELIKADSKTTQNFSQPENAVVLECVDRLLAKGYKPQNIILEKTWASGHGTSGRLDICVTRDDGSEYLLIECKTFDKEFEKESKNIDKNGGQLFTYFKFSNKADVLCLYSSKLEKEKVIYKNKIIEIEDIYRTGDVKDFYNKWNKLPKENGVFDSWVKPYRFESKALTIDNLEPITQESASRIFNQFAEILRHNVVSDKPNAFNKIFTLFLCKVYDETSALKGEELKFQWKEGVDTHVSFQLRLTDLYKKGMDLFLSRTVSDIGEVEFKNKYKTLSAEIKEKLLKDINILRLEKNNEFAIKEVYDHDSFLDNAKVVKEVVKLLQGYQIRYAQRQQYLSDFFELLLTTGLKQEAGQFFTPVPVAQFMIKCLPLDNIVSEKLNSKDGEILPYMIDYASGSGHFITEYMHEVQCIINKKELSNFIDRTSKKIKNWQDNKYDWATEYVYGIEKDYRLVKVGKVGCYLHGDGVANVILSDGLANFSNCKDYKNKLKKEDDDSKDNQNFDIILSNPPYSVKSFKQTTRNYYTEKDFELYNNLTDNSSEIECLFVERTKQLLKDEGIAGIILPSSILTNTGIYTKTRELIYKYFEIIGIVELGSNTFMATSTNTVVLFLKRRNNYHCLNLQTEVDRFFDTLIDVTIDKIETPINKYVNYVFDNLSYDDYLTLLHKKPNEKVKNHDIFKEYKTKIKSKNDEELFNKIIEIEKEKIYYFLLAFKQKVVIVKTGEKDKEKQFLGYEFSNAKGHEGIHPIQKSKTIEECTKLFDINTFENPKKASTYIYKAFNKDLDFKIDESLKDNISRIDLVDMMTFDRVDFEKVINTKSKKKLKIESKWEVKTLGEICANIYQPKTITTKELIQDGKYNVYGANGIIGKFNKYNHENSEIAITCRGATCGTVNYTLPYSWITGNAMVVVPKDNVNKLFLYYILSFSDLSETISGAAQPQITRAKLLPFKLPLPPLEIQEKIVEEIEEVEKSVKNLSNKIINIKNKIEKISQVNCQIEKLENYAEFLKRGKSPKYQDKSEIQIIKSGQIRGLNLFDFTNKYFASESMQVDDRLLQKGDLLINSTGVGTAGRVNIFKLDGKYFVDSHVTILRLDSRKLLPMYALYQLYYYIGFKNIESMANGQSGQIELSIKTIANIKIPVPPIEEQQKIVSQIEELEQEISKAQQIIDNSKNKKQEIFKKYL